MNRVIVVDNGFVYRRAMMAFRNNYASTAPEIWLGMMIGYLKILNATLDDLVIVADDYSSWRKKYYTKYKQQRKEQREQLEEPEWWNEVFKEYNNLVPTFNKCLPWHFVKKWEIEADDWGAVCSRHYKDKKVILISSDSDWEQLFVYPNVEIFSLISKKFKERVNGYQVLQKKIEEGDAKDNVCSEGETKEDFMQREKVLSLLKLPDEIENPLKWELSNLPVKPFDVSSLPFYVLKKRLRKLYNV